MDWIHRLQTRFFFWRLYRRFKGKGWSVACKSPDLLNVAFPDRSVQYVIASFDRSDRVRLTGRIPLAAVAVYTSLTLYDTSGTPVASLYDDQLASLHQRYEDRYKVILGQDLPIPSTSYCLIFRVYFATPQKRLRLDLLPTLWVRDKDQWERLPKTPASEIQRVSRGLTDEITSFLARRSLPNIREHAFFLPSTDKTARFFANRDAIYMVASPKASRVMRISGTFPSQIGRTQGIRYVGFMACDLATTRTDASIGHNDLPRRYRVWVAATRTEAIAHGMRPHEPLLLWSPTTTVPIVVYREVRVNGKGLFSLTPTTRRVSSTRCKAIMKTHFPLIEAL